MQLLNRIIIFIERKSIIYLRYMYILFMIIALLIDQYTSLDVINIFFLQTFENYISYNNSEIITIATIFIGIYFSVYTILMSSNSDSAFSRLSKRNKISLINILNEGFLNSFAYVILSLLLSTVNDYLPFFFSMLRFGLLIAFLYSALIFGVDIFILMREDIKKNIND